MDLDCALVVASFKPTAAFECAIEGVLARQKSLGLSDWDIRVAVVDGLGPTHYAALDYRENEKVAQIKLAREVAEKGNLDFISRCVAHELMHLVLRRYEGLANRAVANLPEPLRATMADLVNDELELVVEDLAGAFVPTPRFLPLDEDERQSWPSFARG